MKQNFSLIHAIASNAIPWASGEGITTLASFKRSLHGRKPRIVEKPVASIQLVAELAEAADKQTAHLESLLQRFIDAQEDRAYVTGQLLQETREALAWGRECRDGKIHPGHF